MFILAMELSVHVVYGTREQNSLDRRLKPLVKIARLKGLNLYLLNLFIARLEEMVEVSRARTPL